MPFQRIELSVDRLDPVGEVAQGIASADSVRELFRAVFLFASRTTSATAVHVALHDPATGLRRCVYAAVLLARDEETITIQEERDLGIHPALPLGDGPQSDAIRTGEAVRTPDLNASAGDPARADAADDLDRLPRSSVVLPFGGGGAPLGVIELRSPEPGAFPEDHVRSLRIATDLAGVALENLRLRDEESQAGKAVEAERRHLRELVDHAPIMMASLQGPEHVFTAANRRYREALGRDGIIGKRVRDVFPEVEAQGFLGILDTVYRSGESFSAEAMPVDIVVHGTRRRFYLNFLYQPLRDAEREVTGILASVNDVTNQVLAHQSLEKAHNDLRRAYEETIAGWATALDLKDEATAGHSQRVTGLAVELAEAMGVAGQALEHVRWGALLHDIGKMGIPDAILRKPDRLTPREWEVMKSHTTYAEELLRPIAHLRPALDIPLHHHERWDGRGYPAGLRGTEIPLPARIFAVVDVYDALTSDRPYRGAWSHERTLEHVREESGRRFDPDVVAAFLRLVGRSPRAVARRDS